MNNFEIEIHEAKPKEKEELKAWAKTFDHENEPSPWPLYVVTKGEKKLGYFYVANPVLIWPSLDYKCTPRETKTVIEMVQKRAKLCGNPAAVVPKDSDTFTPEAMKKLGFEETNCLLYIIP